MRGWTWFPVFLLIAGCAVNPVTRRPEFVVMSARQEREIGAREAANVEKAMGLVDDSDLVAYVRRIGDRLAVHSPWQDVVYTFHVVDMAEPNAFALPGGFVYVTRGLLALVNSEDELACIIGHEIGHIAARHAVQRISRAVTLAPVAIVTGIAGAVTSIVSPMLGDALGRSGALAVEAALAPYSRRQENQADEVGQVLAAKAGYDPATITDFFRSLDRQVTLMLGEPRQPSFLDTHPSTPERVRKTAARAEQLTRGEGTPIAATRSAFLGELEGIVIGPDPALGLFEGARFLHPQLGFAIQFPEDWRTVHTRTLVAAAPSQGGAFVSLQIAAASDEPAEVARAFAQEVQPDIAASLEPTEIAGLRAARAHTTMRGTSFEFTWIAHSGYVYLVSGVSPSRDFERYRAILRGSSESFRALSSAELAAIRESRLRIREGRSGEALANFAARTDASWSAEQIAVANALKNGARLQDQQLLKVAVPQAFTPRGVGRQNVVDER
jgi:predicted Zn-dependent protease